MSALEEARGWANRADRDFLLIENEIHSRTVPWELVAFHAQQAGEKYLKCYIVHSAQEAPRIHDLVELLDLCRNRDATMGSLREDCALLNRYAIAPRYPSATPDPTEAQAREAIASAERIRTAIRQRLGL